MSTQPQTRPQGHPPRPPRPSPIGDLIRKHRETMRDVYARHSRELDHPQPYRRAA
jgi:hypothetical protein